MLSKTNKLKKITYKDIFEISLNSYQNHNFILSLEEGWKKLLTLFFKDRRAGNLVSRLDPALLEEIVSRIFPVGKVGRVGGEGVTKEREGGDGYIKG